VTHEPDMPIEQRLMPYQAVRQIARGRAVVFAPHPDDETFGCAGAIMRHAESGDDVTVVVVTDGGHGRGAHADVARRKEECRLAAKLLGYGQPRFWDMPDRGVVYGERLVREMLAEVEAANADIVYAPSVFEMHPDHRALGMAALETVRRLGRGLLAMYEVGIAMRPNRLLDITDLAERKERAMQAYASQLAVQSYERQIRGLNVFRTYTLPKGVEAAEGYLVLDAAELGQDPLGVYLPEYRRQRLLGLDLDSGSRPLVTVIVRHGRDAAGLARTLDSLALQTYGRVEVVVVESSDAPGKDEAQLCGRFPQRTLVAAASASPEESANLALEEAGGTYLVVLDSGSVLAPDHVARLVDLLEDHEGDLVAYAGARMAENASPVQNAPFDRGRLLGDPYIPLGAVLFARRLVEDGCRFDGAQGKQADHDLLMQLAARSRFTHDDQVSVILPERTVAAANNTLLAKWSGESSVDALAELAASRQHLQVQLDTQGRLLAEQRERLAALERDNHDVRLELGRLLESRSWRLTAPLRWAASLLMRLAGRRRVSGSKRI
jgi:LmbE family N-acetylglucosaminyl deacetylase